jgi:hypothetical protein
MFPWSTFWAPQIYFPYSNFAQTVEPITDWFFGAIPSSAGNARVERKAVDVASYGRQLGLITELLIDLAKQAPPTSQEGKQALKRLADIKARIDALKEQDAQSLLQDIEAKLAQLKQQHPASYQALAGRLGAKPAPLLLPGKRG